MAGTDGQDRERRRIEEERRRQQARSKEARERVNNGRWFHIGMAAMRGETRENGWVTEHTVRTLEGIRRHDTARVVDPSDKRFAEYKSGKTPANEALGQLEKDRELLAGGWSGTFIRVEGVRFDRKLERELAKLAREFPDQFDIVYVSREQAAIAIAKGKQLESRDRNQLSLFDEQKMRQKELRRREIERMKEVKRIREVAAKAEAAAKEKREREEKEREQRARDAAAAARQQRARDENERQQHIRSLAEAAESQDQRSRAESAERAAAQERAERERLAREAYERGRARLPSEVADLLFRTYPAPGDEVHGGPGPHSGGTRGGAAERQRMRERDPRGRERR
ncbi:hypothetical protein [Nocardia nova]|uniref:hypothetical protein n=1 Tax=Nocardia nova TaxID=37330 RepID=UPI003401059D